MFCWRILPFLLLSACNCQQPQSVFLPAALIGKVEVIASCESNCDETGDADILKQAIKPPGDGGISSGVLVRLTDDVTVYRLWNGPTAKLNAYGGTNRLGAWWTADKPNGTRDDYRRNNAICEDWDNQLAWEVKCTLKKGTVVAVGPTQSANCRQGPSFQANPTLQIYVDNTASRFVSCPKVESDNQAERDFEVNPDELLLPNAAVPDKKPNIPATPKKTAPTHKRQAQH